MMEWSVQKTWRARGEWCDAQITDTECGFMWSLHSYPHCYFRGYEKTLKEAKAAVEKAMQR